MIIWGSRGREVTVSSGRFNCPNCEGDRPYKLKRLAKYFTLYFVPLFQTSNLGEYVECQVCGQTYKIEVLSYKLPSSAEKLLIAIRNDLETGMPLHMLQKKLVALGLETETANELVEIATGGNQVTCKQCQFTFLGTIQTCSNCGYVLNQTLSLPSRLTDSAGKVEMANDGANAIYCGECGTANPFGNRFCWKCGQRIQSE